MSALRIRYQTIELGDLDIHVRGLRDTREFNDPGGVAEGMGIAPSHWPLFGVLWESGQVLARLMVDYDVEGRRILEVGCGLGLAALVLNQQRADVSATDRHPEVEEFLRQNVALNGGAPIPFVRADWADRDIGLGRFDLIIGSDLLYEPGHAESLSGFVDHHAQPRCEMILVDPGRGQLGRFGRLMGELGYTSRKRQAPESTGDSQSRLQTYSYSRG